MIMNFQGLFSSSLQCHAKWTATRSVAVPGLYWSQIIICKCVFWELLIFLTTSLQSEQNTSHCCNLRVRTFQAEPPDSDQQSTKQGFRRGWAAWGGAAPFCSLQPLQRAPGVLEGHNICLLTSQLPLWYLNFPRESVCRTSSCVISVLLHYLMLA